jgi:hypothetical protein
MAGGCEACVLDNCIQSSCNKECRYVGGTCETIYLGFGGDEGLMAMRENNEKMFHGVNWRMKVQPTLQIVDGAFSRQSITHIHGKQISTIDNWQEVIAGLKDGDKLITRDVDGKRWEITLPDECVQVKERESK